MPGQDRRKKKKLWRKRNNFNKGYTPWNNKVQFELGVEADSSNAANIKVSRPKIEIYEAALTQHNGAANTLPTRLRPRRSSHKEKTEEQEDCSENIIVNFSKLKDFIKKCLKHRCRNTSKVDVAIAKRMGLCISLQANCEKCNFDTRACKVYTECEKKSRGPAAGYLHEAMTLAILKTKMGGTDLQMALACLNIKVPSLQLISTNVNKQCDKMIELNEAAMEEKQKLRRKRNNFNKGYTPWNNKVQFELGVEADSSNAANIKVSRPKIEIYEAALTQHNGAANTLPTRLRPRRSHKEEAEEQEDCSENIIVNFSKLKDFIKKCLKHRCRNTSKVDVAIAKRMGLCISLQANCEKCNFDTRAFKVYTECEKKQRTSCWLPP
ncbi:unnamed protein product [Mytilus edulis]|uniref:Mutator-like transposase domain-containing protein n=1 Tax=Mytilus edulis TaxID=6550 RepID=A0A8S3PVF7_MYTED|nr:unnamed protein product [Mytilus edulis]